MEIQNDSRLKCHLCVLEHTTGTKRSLHLFYVTISRAKIHFLIPFMAIYSEGYFTMKNLGNAILNFDTLNITGSAKLFFTSFSIPYHKIPISQMA